MMKEAGHFFLKTSFLRRASDGNREQSSRISCYIFEMVSVVTVSAMADTMSRWALWQALAQATAWYWFLKNN
jgi:hypothetical protein